MRTAGRVYDEKWCVAVSSWNQQGCQRARALRKCGERVVCVASYHNGRFQRVGEAALRHTLHALPLSARAGSAMLHLVCWLLRPKSSACMFNVISTEKAEEDLIQQIGMDWRRPREHQSGKDELEYGSTHADDYYPDILSRSTTAP